MWSRDKERERAYKRACADSLKEIQKEYGITQKTHPRIIQQEFDSCAAVTGTSKTIAGMADVVDEFKRNGTVPDFVLQACSGKKAKE